MEWDIEWTVCSESECVGHSEGAACSLESAQVTVRVQCTVGECTGHTEGAMCSESEYTGYNESEYSGTVRVQGTVRVSAMGQ